MKKSMELRQDRTALLDRAREIERRVETEKRELTRDERREFDSALSKAEILQHEIPDAEDEERAEHDRFEGRGSSGSGEGRPRVPRESQQVGAEFAITSKGEEIRLLKPSESLRSVVPNTLPDNARPEEFSIGRAIRGLVTCNWKNADLERRALSEGSGIGGGYLLQPILSAEILDLARNLSVVTRAGARTVAMDGPELVIARLTGDATAEWKSENQALTGSDVTFGQFVLRARTLACLVTASLELIEDAANLDSIVRNSIAQALGLELDRAILRGEPGGARITGLRNWTGDPPTIQIIDLGENGAELITYDPFSEAVEKILTANGTPNAAIFAPRTYGVLDRFRTIDGQPLQPPASFAGLTRLVSNQIPINLTHGTADDASEAYVGDFSKLLVGMRTQLQIEVSREAGDAFKKGQVLTRAYLRADALPVQPTHFVLIDGIIPAGA